MPRYLDNSIVAAAPDKKRAPVSSPSSPSSPYTYTSSGPLGPPREREESMSKSLFGSAGAWAWHFVLSLGVWAGAAAGLGALAAAGITHGAVQLAAVAIGLVVLAAADALEQIRNRQRRDHLER